MGKAVIEVPAIAAGSTPADPLPFQNNDARARFCELARSTKTGKAAADDGYIIVTLYRTFRRPRERGAVSCQ